MSGQLCKWTPIKANTLVFCWKISQYVPNSACLRRLSLLYAGRFWGGFVYEGLVFWSLGSSTILLSACGGFHYVSSSPTDGFIQELPEGVLSIVAPNQNLNSVRIDPEDGCFVYRHIGPVETTFLPGPVRTKWGKNGKILIS